jgi:adenine-specific DNA-methyltransferase
MRVDALQLDLPLKDAAPLSAEARGAVYTPPVLASWVASELVTRLRGKRSYRVLDPACGDGVLLAAVESASRQSGKTVRLQGIDIDGEAARQSATLLGRDADLHTADTLWPSPTRSPVEGLRDILGGAPDAIIANPPWGAVLSHSSDRLRSLGYELATGQYDSFEVFVELCVNLAPAGGLLAFIIPDSIFLPEHERLRRLLLDKTTILLLARLGEGFFSGVYRGTTVLLVKKGPPAQDAHVWCFRLTPQRRKAVLEGQLSMSDASAELGHEVLQSRFAHDAHARFDLELREDETRIVDAMETNALDWSRWVVAGRGVELSKTGRVVECPNCLLAHPQPRGQETTFRCRCGHVFELARARSEVIIRPLGETSSVGWAPIIVGEDVDRHYCRPSREIRLGVSGIQYKTPELFQARKLLVRKTGVGIKAAVDESGAYTNQVVFIFTLRRDAQPPEFLLDYMEGVLCSRVLLAYHLRRSGETEWRSHPYVTPKVLRQLPIPDLTPGTSRWNQARAIAEAVAVRRRDERNHASIADLHIERLVAGLYGLSSTDCAWALSVLDQAQQLEAIHTLRLAGDARLTPELVA